MTFALIGNVAGDIWEYHRNAVAHATNIADYLGRAVLPRLASGSAKDAGIPMQAIAPGLNAVAFYDGQGRLVNSYVKPGLAIRIPDMAGAAGATVSGKELAMFRPLPQAGPVHGTVYLVAHYDLTDTIVEDIGIAAAVSVCALVIAMMMIARLEKNVTLPIATASDMARQVVEQRDYSRRAQKFDNDEVGVLARR